MDLLRLKNPAGCRNADIRKFTVDPVFQRVLDLCNGPGHSRDIMNLSIDNSSCRVLNRFLCHHNKAVCTYPVTNRPNDAPCANIQTKYKTFIVRFHSKLTFHLFNYTTFFIVCLVVLLSVQSIFFPLYYYQYGDGISLSSRPHSSDCS